MRGSGARHKRGGHARAAHPANTARVDKPRVREERRDLTAIAPGSLLALLGQLERQERLLCASKSSWSAAARVCMMAQRAHGG